MLVIPLKCRFAGQMERNVIRFANSWGEWCDIFDLI